MQLRQLGKNGFSASEIGLGCWQFGGDFGPMAEDTAYAIIESAVDSSVNFLDTANVYGGGKSESIIGDYLQKNPGAFRVATKYGRGPDAYPNKYSLAGMRNAVKASLSRLKLSKLDLLQLHCVPIEVLRKGEIFESLRQLQNEGLIRHFGASVESIEEGLLCLEQPGLLSLQVIFNMFRQKLATGLLPQAAMKGVGVIVRLPLASGLLSGKFNAASQFSPTDHRNYNRDGQHFNVGETFAGLPFNVGVQLSDKLKEMIPANMTLLQVAMRWILDHEAVSTVIPGASSTSQVLANIATSNLAPLSKELHVELKKFYDEEVAQHIRGPY